MGSADNLSVTTTESTLSPIVELRQYTLQPGKRDVLIDLFDRHRPRQFSFPQGIMFAPDGTLLVDNSGNDRIQRFTLSANDTVLAWDATYAQFGAGSASPAGDLNNPTGISVAADGTLGCRHAQQPISVTTA